MAIVKHVGPTSAFRVGFVVYAFLGFIAGVFCSAMALAGVPFAPHAHLPHLVGLFAVVLCPILYGIIGGVGLLISARLYNLASAWVGGLELDVN
jgi:hypothetical protein